MIVGILLAKRVEMATEGIVILHTSIDDSLENIPMHDTPILPTHLPEHPSLAYSHPRRSTWQYVICLHASPANGA